MDWRGFGFVHHSRTLFCRAVPNPNITIRNFFIAVGGGRHKRAPPLKERCAGAAGHVPSAVLVPGAGWDHLRLRVLRAHVEALLQGGMSLFE